MQKRLLTTSLLVPQTFPEAFHKVVVGAGDEQVEVVFIIVSGYQSHTKLMVELAVGKQGSH